MINPRLIRQRIELINATYLVLLVFGVALSVIWSSYFGANLVGLFSYIGYDPAWCDVENEAIGWHCFGDFHQFINTSKFDPNLILPNGTEIGQTSQSRSLFGTTIYDSFNLLGGLVGHRLSLLIFLFLSAVTAAWPIFHATQDLKASIRIQTTLLLGVCTVPFLATIDRGQLWGFVSVLLYLGGRFFVRREYAAAGVSLAFAASIKPQFLLLLLLFLLVGSFRHFIRALIAFSTVSLLSFVVHGMDALARLNSWYQQMFHGGVFAFMASESWPFQYGWIRLFNSLSYWTSWITAQPSSTVVAANDAFLVTSIVTGCFLLVLFIRRKHLQNLDLFLCLLVVSVFSLGSVFSYNLMFSTVALSLLVGEKGRINNARRIVICVSLLSLAPIVIPYSFPDPEFNRQDSSGILHSLSGPWPVIVTLGWLVSLIALLQVHQAFRVFVERKMLVKVFRLLAFAVFGVLMLSVFYYHRDRNIDFSHPITEVAHTSVVGIPGDFGDENSDTTTKAFGLNLLLPEDSESRESQSIFVPASNISGCPSVEIRFLKFGINLQTSFVRGEISDSLYFPVDTRNKILIRWLRNGSAVQVVTDKSSSTRFFSEGRCVEFANLTLEGIDSTELRATLTYDHPRSGFVQVLLFLSILLILVDFARRSRILRNRIASYSDRVLV